MIILTKHGDKSNIPYMFAYQGGAFIFNFYMDSSYLDPYDSLVWSWVGYDYGIDEVLGVIQDDGSILVDTISVNDCMALTGSWFWDDTNGYLYVHWFDSHNDYIIDRDIAIYSSIISGYASGYHRLTQNVFDGVYYRPIITKLTGLKKTVDPIELGLISYGTSSISLSNYNGEFDYILEAASTGLPIWIYYVPDDVALLTNAMRIFTGYLSGTKNDRSNITYEIEETRLYENKPVCVNTITVAAYPDCDDKAGELMPVAFGDVRRGKMILINGGIIESPYPDPLVLTFLVADPSLYAILSIDHVYDDTDNEYTIDSVDLVNCTVTITSDDYAGTVDEFAEFDFDAFTWEGTGYDIAGTYNNGLDIIQAAFLKFSAIPYLASTYDTTQWAAQTTLHPEAVGICVQSDGGFIEEIIEPITVSLFGIVDILGDGRISFRSRDITSPVDDIIYPVDQLKEPAINNNSEKTVSELVIEYARNFNDDEKKLQYVDTTHKDSVIAMYGINRRDPLSPIKTVLFSEANVIALAGKLMDIHSSPQQQITCESRRLISQNLFDIIGIDVGRHDDEHIIYGEILSVAPDYLGKVETVVIRKIDDPVINDPPDAIILRAVVPSAAGEATVIWDESTDGSTTGYYIYYTSAPPQWSDNIINYTIKTYTPEGKLYRVITGLTPGQIYFFRVSVYNVYGESDPSNFRAMLALSSVNAYRCSGNMATAFVLDESNTLSGTRITAWAAYDGTHTYNGAIQYQPACQFDPGPMYSYPPFKKLTIYGETDAGDILYQIRTSDDGITWSAWSALASCIGSTEIIIASKFYINFRVIYEPDTWHDADNFRILEIA